MAVGRAWSSGLIESFAVLLFVSLCAFWILATLGTLGALRSGEIWRR
jgi:hypothetical protein